MPSNFTAKDAKEQGIKLELLQEWDLLMNAFLVICIRNGLKPKQKDNEIMVGKYRLGVYFMNNKWLEIKIQQKEEELLSMKYKKPMQAFHVVSSFFKHQ